MTKRPICDQCQRPLSTCLCADIVQVTAPVPVVIWQDPREAKHALSTTPLLLASLSNSYRVIAKNLELDELQQHTGLAWQKLALVYPADAALSDSIAADSIPQQDIQGLLLLDGTWKQVKRMLLTHPWLSQLPRIELPAVTASRYKIRATKRSDSMSTMEAALLACGQIDPQFDGQAPLAALDKLVQIQLEHGQRRKLRE